MRVRVGMGLALLAWALTFPPALSGAVTLVEDAYSPAQTDDNQITLSSVQSGDLVAVIAGTTNDANVISVTDDQKHTWTADCPAGQIDHSTSATVRLAARYVVATSAITTITLNSSGGGGTYGAAVVYRGMGTVTCDGSDTDESTATTSHGTTISIAPSTTTATVMFGAIGVAIGSTVFSVPPSGYAEVGTTLDRFWAGSKVVTSTSANTFAMTTTANRDGITVLMALKSSAVVASPCRGILTGVGC